MPRVDAVADPVRLAIARWLAGRAPASASDVAAGVGVHPNTARAHLAALDEAGIAERLARSDGRRGRPVVRYRIDPDWMPAGDELLALSELLAGVLGAAEPDAPSMREAAARWGRHGAGAEGEPVERGLVAAAGRLGFRARVGGDRLELRACPCPLVAPDRPELVCGLADGAIDGVLEGTGTVATDHRHDPAARQCSAILAATAGQ